MVAPTALLDRISGRDENDACEMILVDEAAVSATGTDIGVAGGLEQVLRAFETAWPAGQPRARIITRAPGRLDCMGGMADFSGSLALQMPIDRAAYISAARRGDQCAQVITLGFSEGDAKSSHSWPLSLFYQSDGQFVTPRQISGTFAECPWAARIASICLALLESGELPHFAGGFTLVIKSDIPVGAGLASSAAIEVAAAKALTGLFDVETDAHVLLRICRAAAANEAPTGLVDHAACLLGESGALLQIRCQDDDVLGRLPLPKDVSFAAVDVGLRLPIYTQRYEDNRVSCLLGRCLIERLLRGADGQEPAVESLASITPNEYVQRFRNELPVKMRGRDFASLYGRFGELEGEVDPGQIYKIRSRTEHHIYENDRTHRFLERLARARRTGELDALVEAGELMYASHWSYGQRCGMGSIETDVLVNAIRVRGPARGLFGAKVTAGGCGGAVAVLLADSSTAHAALEEACSAYAEKTGKSPTILCGSSPGAAAFGQRYLD